MSLREGGIIYEFTAHGRFVKVTAMDVRTLTEIAIVGDASRDESELMRIARRKLEYVMNRKGGDGPP